MFRNRALISESIKNKKEEIQIKGYVSKLITRAYELKCICKKYNIGLNIAISAVLNPGVGCDVPSNVIYSVGVLTSVYGVRADMLINLLSKYEIKEISNKTVVLKINNKHI